MINMAPISIWTENDRLCGRCGAQVAQSDDWLCEGCRSGLERYWVKITNNIHYIYGNVPQKENKAVELRNQVTGSSSSRN